MVGIVPPRFSGPLLSILRIVTGLMIFLHGTMKLFAWPPVDGMPVALGSMPGIAGILETAGGFLLIIGLFSRVAAFILSGETAVAYFMVHAGRNLFPMLNGGEVLVFFCFIFLFLAAAGPGPWAIDKPHSPSRLHS